MKFVCPLITVADMEKSRGFYENILKQTVVTDFGVNVSFGGFALHLQSHYQTLIDGKEIKAGGNNFELYFEDDDLEQIVEKLKIKKVEFVHEIREQPWRQQVVRFYDPDKNIIEIGESMEHLIFRLSQEGNLTDAISKMTELPLEFVEQVLRK